MADDSQEMKNLPMCAGRQIAFSINAFFNSNVVYRSVFIYDLLNIQLVDDNLKYFDESWEETVMALEEESKTFLSEGFHHRQLEMSTFSAT